MTSGTASGLEISAPQTKPPSWGKPQDGFMARHFDRKISGFITRYLARLPVTPNQVTLASVAIGLVGAAFLTVPKPSWMLAGAGLLWFHSVVDGCDGELARLKHLKTRLGTRLDFWGDNLVHLALFSSLGVGLWRGSGLDCYLWLGLAADLGVLAAVALYSSSLPSTPLRRRPLILERLAQRDFLYLPPALALAGKLSWFLWAGAVGAPLFSVILLGLALVESRTGGWSL